MNLWLSRGGNTTLAPWMGMKYLNLPRKWPTLPSPKQFLCLVRPVHILKEKDFLFVLFPWKWGIWTQKCFSCFCMKYPNLQRKILSYTFDINTPHLKKNCLLLTILSRGLNPQIFLVLCVMFRSILIYFWFVRKCPHLPKKFTFFQPQPGRGGIIPTFHFVVLESNVHISKKEKKELTLAESIDQKNTSSLLFQNLRPKDGNVP